MTENSSNSYAYYSFPPTPNRNSPRSLRSRSISSNISATSQRTSTKPTYELPIDKINMPSPAAGKSDTPRTPTKLGRKAQQSAPKLNKPQSQVPDTSDVSEKAQSAVEDTKDQAEDTAEDTQEQAKSTAEDAKDTVEDTTKDAQKKAGETAEDAKKKVESAVGDAEDTAEDTTGKVSQKGDELSEAEPKPIDDDDEEIEESEDDATQKAGDEAEDTVDNTEDDATDTASKAGEGALSGARGLAGRASNLAGKASKDPKGAVEDVGVVVAEASDTAHRVSRSNRSWGSSLSGPMSGVSPVWEELEEESEAAETVSGRNGVVKGIAVRGRMVAESRRRLTKGERVGTLARIGRPVDCDLGVRDHSVCVCHTALLRQLRRRRPWAKAHTVLTKAHAR
ncbi:hypothetical protein OPT61_g4690 [Boeremia exigua]|uniref:Uncharacterized protein n=1 Tax=Boeremia exigua TaxID=749465 RepID=A0ACC2IDC1_9PLEO|nr:hypothetical protein OPT61_g4690 [Boeremia exigua]